jgi:hypothetical protein
MVRFLVTFLCVALGATSAAEAAFISPTLEYSSFSKSWETTYFVQPGDPLSYSGITCVTVDGAPAGSTLFLDGVTAQCADYRFGGLRIMIRAPADFTGAVTLTFIVTLPTSGIETARRTFGGFVPPPPPPPPETTLRVRAATWDGTAFTAFEPAAGSPVPTNARVPLGSVVTFQAIDSNGVPVSATFSLSEVLLVDGIESQALFPNEALHQYGSAIPDQDVFQGVHLGSLALTITPSPSSGLAPSTINVTVERPLGLSDTVDPLDDDVVDAAHRTGVPPQYIRAHLAKESGGNRQAFRYEPIGPQSFADLNGISRNGNARSRQPYAFYRLATEADTLNAALPGGVLLVDQDRDTRSSLRVGCDADGSGGAPIGIGSRDPNPTAQEIFRCNDAQQNWFSRTRNNQRRLDQFKAATFTAQTTLAASYGLLQVMYGRAIREGWSSADGAQNPHLLFDNPGAAREGQGSMVVGATIVRKSVREIARDKNAAFPPASREALELLFTSGWQDYNPGERGYGIAVGTLATQFVPRPQAPVLP